jgi:hypothetical protein
MINAQSGLFSKNINPATNNGAMETSNPGIIPTLNITNPDRKLAQNNNAKSIVLLRLSCIVLMISTIETT